MLALKLYIYCMSTVFNLYYEDTVAKHAGQFDWHTFHSEGQNCAKSNYEGKLEEKNATVRALQHFVRFMLWVTGHGGYHFKGKPLLIVLT